MTVNAVKTITLENDGATLHVVADTFLPATPQLVQFCCQYTLVDKLKKRGGEDVPHGNVLWFPCTPSIFSPTSHTAKHFEWHIPNSDRPKQCKPCYLAIVELGIHTKLDWQTQVYPCPPAPNFGVLFDGDASMINPALATSGGPLWTQSHWLRVLPQIVSTGYWQTDPLEDGDNGGAIINAGTVTCDFYEHPQDDPDAGHVRGFAGVDIGDGEWHHVMLAAFTAAGEGGKIILATVDRVPCGVVSSDFGRPFSIYQAGVPFYFGRTGGSTDRPFEVYDLWIDFENFLDIYDPDTLDKFVTEDLKPVDLGENGELPTGSPPTVFGHGGADTFLAPNLGAGGDFFLSGALVTVDGPDA